ncbi:MAG: hypothetical protein CMP61_03140 [Flavobacteriales bacterium]|nr:hypothetical protein [Flavobacteriales bacterium]
MYDDLNKYRSDIIFWISVIILLAISYSLVEVILPFILALLGALMFAPFVRRIQMVVKNRILAVSLSLISSSLFVLAIGFIFANEIVRDTYRLGATFTHFAEANSSKLDESAKWVKETYIAYVEPVIKREKHVVDSISELDLNQLLQKDSLVQKIDVTQLKAVFKSIFSSDQAKNSEIENENSAINWIAVFCSTFGYFIYIIFTWEYFEVRINVLREQFKDSKITFILNEARVVFKSFFQQRGAIVLIYSFYFSVAFYFLGIPGALILGILAGVLCFIPYLQYVVLIPVALFCVILNMEGEYSYWVYLMIAVLIFLVGTIIEEFVLKPKIMHQENSLNPAILLLTLAIFGELMGLFGVMLAVPFTILLKSYLKRVILYRMK